MGRASHSGLRRPSGHTARLRPEGQKPRRTWRLIRTTSRLERLHRRPCGLGCKSAPRLLVESFESLRRWIFVLGAISCTSTSSTDSQLCRTPAAAYSTSTSQNLITDQERDDHTVSSLSQHVANVSARHEALVVSTRPAIAESLAAAGLSLPAPPPRPPSAPRPCVFVCPCAFAPDLRSEVLCGVLPRQPRATEGARLSRGRMWAAEDGIPYLCISEVRVGPVVSALCT